MDIREITDGLAGLGFTTGFAISGDPAEIIVWENTAKQPTDAEISGAISQGIYLREYDAVSATRHALYTSAGGSDSVFMQYQRGQATEQEWLDAVQAINDANPYPVKKAK